MRGRRTAVLAMALLIAMPAVAQGPGAYCAKGMRGDGAHRAMGSEPLTESGLEALGLAIQDEHRAEALYQQVLEQHGDVRPFAHIVNAERRHSAALESVYSRRGLAAPDNLWPDLSQELQGKSLQEVCQAAVEAERDNVALYDELLGRDLPADVVQVFEHLRDASLLRHLSAFERCGSGAASKGPMRSADAGCCGRGRARGGWR